MRALLMVMLLAACGPGSSGRSADGGLAEDGPPPSCGEGFELSGTICVDIDECATDNGGCGDPAVWICQNLPGTAPRCLLDCRVDYGPLTQGVSTLDQGGALPSLIVVHGDAACPLLPDENGALFAAYARYGDGRALHVGHEALLTGPSGDAVTLLGDTVRWAGQSDEPVVGVEEGSGVEAAEAVLDGLGLAAAVVPANSLDGIDVLVTSSYVERSDAQYAAIQEFVRQGGGLVQGGHAWWWSYSNDNVAERYMGNRILNDMGLTVTEGTVNAGIDLVTVDPPSPLLHAGQALDAISYHLSGVATLDALDQQQAVRTVRTAVQYLPVSFSGYWDRVRLLLDEIDPVVPTTADPVEVETEIFEALIVTIWSRLADGLPPEEMEVVPSDWPGAVAEHAPRVTRTVSILASYAGMDPDYLYAGALEPVWRGTGLYAVPGEVVTVTIPAAWVNQGLSVLIGAYTDTLWQLSSWTRYPDITRAYRLDSETTPVASGFGGPIYIRVPGGIVLGMGDVTIEGAVEYPRYVHGVTTPAEWQAIVAAQGVPMVEFESDKFVLTLHRSELGDIADPGPLIDFWNAVLDADADLAAIGRDRVRAERFAVDRQISAGWMHSGYPLMGYAYGATLSDATLLAANGDWGAFHELGHDHQLAPAVLPGTTEATCNLWSVYVSETVVGITRDQAHPALVPADRTARIEAYVAGGRNFYADWTVWTALETYLQLQESFGWPLILAAHARYLAMADRPATDQDRIDTWVIVTSEEAGLDMTAFYDRWGFPMSASVYSALSSLPPWTDHPMVPY